MLDTLVVLGSVVVRNGIPVGRFSLSRRFVTFYLFRFGALPPAFFVQVDNVRQAPVPCLAAGTTPPSASALGQAPPRLLAGQAHDPGCTEDVRCKACLHPSGKKPRGVQLECTKCDNEIAHGQEYFVQEGVDGEMLFWCKVSSCHTKIDQSA